MINFKQQQLLDELFQAVKLKFPELEFINVTESPEDPADLLLNVTAPEDEDREIELSEFASQLSTDILQDYRYLILVMSRSNGSLARAHA